MLFWQPSGAGWLDELGIWTLTRGPPEYMQGRQLLGTERTQTYDDILDGGRDKRGLDTVPTLSFWTDRMSLESDRTLGPWRPVR